MLVKTNDVFATDNNDISSMAAQRTVIDDKINAIFFGTRCARKEKKLRKQIVAMVLASAMVVTAVPVQTQIAGASDETGTETPTAVDGYYYGIVNMEYADFFYGELTDNEASDATAPALSVDKVAEYRSEGMYDTVTSATSTKSTRYSTSYYETGVTNDEGDTDTCTNLYGIKEVQFKVSVDLYNNFMDEADQDNKVYEYLEEASWSEEAFTTEYKVLNADGTFSKLITDEGETQDEDAEVSLSLATTWGDYQVSIDNLGIPQLDEDGNEVTEETTDRSGNATTSTVYEVEATTDNLYGIIVEDMNGEKYGMLHSDNTWVKTYEFAWAVEDDFSVHGTNSVPNERTDGLTGGNTITKITYLLKDSADLVVETETYIKKLVNTDTYGYTGENTIYADGASIQMTGTTPEDSEYTLVSVSFGGETLTSGTDYTYADDLLTIYETENTGIGTYTLTYSDENYGDITATVQFTSSLAADKISIQNNQIIIDSDEVDIADYVAAIDSITVNGETLKSTTGVVNEDGTINLDASVSFHGSTTVVFPDDGEYTIEITSAGYPSVSGTVVKDTTDDSDDTADDSDDGSEESTPTAEPTATAEATATPAPTTDTSSATVAPTAEPTATTTVKSTTVSKVKGLKVKAAKKKLKVTWKKKAGVSGYQIEYSANKKFKKSKKQTIKKASATSLTLKKLKAGKKYYVRIRAYKTVSGKKKYSAWSSVKSAKVKK